MTAPRYAVYFVPPQNSPLARFGAAAIGYDVHAQSDVLHLKLDGVDPSRIACATENLRRYGFHATLVAPFEIKSEQDGTLVSVLDAFAHNRPPVSLGRLVPTIIRDFIALVPAEPHPAISELAKHAVMAFDSLRRPLSPEDRERRRGKDLTPRQRKHLERWGYPYVFDEFRLHLSLAGVLPAAEREPYRVALETAFASLADDPVTIDWISLLRQDDRDGHFRILAERPLRE